MKLLRCLAIATVLATAAVAIGVTGVFLGEYACQMAVLD